MLTFNRRDSKTQRKVQLEEMRGTHGHLLLILFLHQTFFVRSTFGTVPQDSVTSEEILEQLEAEPIDLEIEKSAAEGRLQFQLISHEASVPRYGTCYQKAVTELQAGCKHLTDEVQSRLALALTNCYTERFGWGSYPCGSETPLSECMAPLDDRVTSVYSAMLTNTLAMCQFLQAQAWRRSTYEAVDRLRGTSEAVSAKLAQAVDSAANLNQELRQQLTSSRDAVREAFSELRESTMEQRGMVEGVFKRLANLQSLVVDEFSWFYGVVFYVAGVVLALMVTCTPRTGGARLPLFGLLALSLILERVLTSRTMQETSSLPPHLLQEELSGVVWTVRRVCVILCFCVVVVTGMKYQDAAKVTAARLQVLSETTGEIKKLLHSHSGVWEVSSGPLADMKELFDVSASSDETFMPSDEDQEEEDAADEHETPFALGGGGKEGLCKVSHHYNLREQRRRIGDVNEEEEGGCGDDTLRWKRNPRVNVESPETFGRIVRHMEIISRKKSSLMRWRQSRLGTSNGSVISAGRSLELGEYSD